MLTKAKSTGLRSTTTSRILPKVFVLRMDKHEYLQILDAVKAHTGNDAEILGNANKRH